MEGDIPLSLFRYESATIEEMFDRKMVRPEGLAYEYPIGSVLNTGYGESERIRFVVTEKVYLLVDEVDDDLAYSCGFRPDDGLTEGQKFTRWLDTAYPDVEVRRVVVYTLRRI